MPIAKRRTYALKSKPKSSGMRDLSMAIKKAVYQEIIELLPSANAA